MTKQRNSLRGKVVATTGGSRGIGKATGTAFLRAGARVALGDIDAELAEKTADELGESIGGEVCGCELDVTDRPGFAAFLDHTEHRLGPLDVLVNNVHRRHPAPGRRTVRLLESMSLVSEHDSQATRVQGWRSVSLDTYRDDCILINRRNGGRIDVSPVVAGTCSTTRH